MMRLTRRVEGGGIDCRTIDAALMCGVHDSWTRPTVTTDAATTKTVMATCREIVGLSSSRLEEVQQSRFNRACGRLPRGGPRVGASNGNGRTKSGPTGGAAAVQAKSRQDRRRANRNREWERGGHIFGGQEMQKKKRALSETLRNGGLVATTQLSKAEAQDVGRESQI